MTKPVILTGIRANNDLHIGNYFGAMRPIIEMATSRIDEFDVNFFIPDLHSITTPIDYTQLHHSVLNTAKLYFAAGLPLDNSVSVYRQSYVPAHSELTIILNNFTSFGEMNRMTQFKDKSAKLHDEQVSVGLFDYPVLMASDILLYNTRYVPVGDDQSQHLEITRDIAIRFNNKFGQVFTIPEAVSDQHAFFGNNQGLRIMNLVDPTKKMSKSDDTDKGTIFLTDSLDSARRKIMGATTDNYATIAYDKQKQPGISNLIEILALLTNKTNQEIAQKYKSLTQYGSFKQVVAEEMTRFLADFQTKLNSIDELLVTEKLESSEAKVAKTANQTLLRAQKAVGLRP